VRPSYKALENLPIAEQRKRLRDPDLRRKILAERPSDAEVAKLAQFRQLITKRWDKFFIMGDPPDYEPDAEMSVAAIATRTGRPPDEVAYDWRRRPCRRCRRGTVGDRVDRCRGAGACGAYRGDSGTRPCLCRRSRRGTRNPCSGDRQGEIAARICGNATRAHV